MEVTCFYFLQWNGYSNLDFQMTEAMRLQEMETIAGGNSGLVSNKSRPVGDSSQLLVMSLLVGDVSTLIGDSSEIGDHSAWVGDSSRHVGNNVGNITQS